MPTSLGCRVKVWGAAFTLTLRGPQAFFETAIWRNPDRAGNLFTLQLDAEKTGEEINRHFPRWIAVVKVVSQAIFEESLGSFFSSKPLQI